MLVRVSNIFPRNYCANIWRKNICFFKSPIRAFSRLRISAFTQNFWVFSFYIADFWQTFWVIWENGSNQIKFEVENEIFFSLGRLKNHNVPHLHPNSTMFMPLDRFQLKIYAFSGKFNLSQFYAPNSDFYSEIQELTQILLRISEEKIGGWRLWLESQTGPPPHDKKHLSI